MKSDHWIINTAASWDQIHGFSDNGYPGGTVVTADQGFLEQLL